uniref:Uncharacterized protein n=1 Tax=Oryza nivara TaxID=4536 RepID=A0A0E0HEM4_ORYNI
MWAKDVSLSSIFFSCPLPACAFSPRRSLASAAPAAAAVWITCLISKFSLCLVQVHADCASPCRGGERMVPHLKEMCSSLAASKELVKALFGIWGPGDGLNLSTASMLYLARAHARQLAKEDRRRGDETAQMRAQLAEEARESRERLEKVCDELVRGGLTGGVDGNRGGKEEVEEMRREAERAQEELEKEREMLRLADELRHRGLPTRGAAHRHTKAMDCGDQLRRSSTGAESYSHLSFSLRFP